MALCSAEDDLNHLYSICLPVLLEAFTENSAVSPRAFVR